jgi:methylenetetrahydrofolate reductase (NADPH)
MSIAHRHAPGPNHGEGFARNFSIEATRPTAAEIEEVARIIGRGRPLYLSAVPAQSYEEHADKAALVRRAGLEPVIHLTARRLSSAQQLNDFLKRLRGEADVSTVLALAGDVAQQGPYQDALALIRDGALQQAGITELGISAYPEGHPSIAGEALDAALRNKIAAARETGLKLHIVSQFSFDPEAVVGWLKRLRAAGIAAPVRVGMAGPTGLTALLRYARRCGVKASMTGLVKGTAASLLGHLGSVGPDSILDALEAARHEIGDAHPHYFSFGGLAATARYAQEQIKKAVTA